MKTKSVLVGILGVASILLMSFSFVGLASEREDLIKAAKEEIEDLRLPYTGNYTITYEQENKSVTIVFETLPEFKVNYNLYYMRWWDAQFIALDCFKKRDIPVGNVSVITNFVDGSGPMKATTKASYIRKYANATHGMGKWLDLTDSFLWDEGTKEWNPLT